MDALWEVLERIDRSITFGDAPGSRDLERAVKGARALLHAGDFLKTLDHCAVRLNADFPELAFRETKNNVDQELWPDA